MAAMGRPDDARGLFVEATRTNPRWSTFLERFAASGAQPGRAEPARRLLGG
jgi:hypothetical protein